MRFVQAVSQLQESESSKIRTLIMVRPQLHTQRLLLNPLSLADHTSLHELWIQPTVRKYLWDDVVISAEQVTDILRTNLEQFAKEQSGLWGIHLKGAPHLIGFCGLWYFFEEPQPQLLYGLGQGYYQKGYAQEAAHSVIEYAFSTLGFSYLTAAIDAPHQASIRLAERLGMKRFRQDILEGKPTLFYRLEA